MKKYKFRLETVLKVRTTQEELARAALAQIAARWDTRLIAIKKMAEQASKSGAPAGTASTEE